MERERRTRAHRARPRQLQQTPDRRPSGRRRRLTTPLDRGIGCNIRSRSEACTVKKVDREQLREGGTGGKQGTSVRVGHSPGAGPAAVGGLGAARPHPGAIVRAAKGGSCAGTVGALREVSAAKPHPKRGLPPSPHTPPHKKLTLCAALGFGHRGGPPLGVYSQGTPGEGGCTSCPAHLWIGSHS